MLDGRLAAANPPVTWALFLASQSSDLSMMREIFCLCSLIWSPVTMCGYGVLEKWQVQLKELILKCCLILINFNVNSQRRQHESKGND